MAEIRRAETLSEMPNILDHHVAPVPDDPIGSSKRLKLSNIMQDKDYWRIYIDRYNHGPAFVNWAEDPGHIYDDDQSPGFQQSMVEAYQKVLDGDLYAAEFTSGILTFDHYKDLYDLTSKYIKNDKWKFAPRTNLAVEFGIDPAIVASDAREELLYNRPLLGPKSDPAFGNAISWLDNGSGITNTQPDVFPILINEAFQRFHTEMAQATLKRHQLKAIAKLIRFLHVFHMFGDGNGRLHCHLLLPRLLMEHGFGPPLKLGPYCWRQTLFGLFNGCFTLDQIVKFLWHAQQKDSQFEEVVEPKKKKVK